MEERIDTFAAGAGAISRLVTYDQEKDETVKCTRVENVKNMDVYIERIDEMKERLERCSGYKRQRDASPESRNKRTVHLPANFCK